MKIDLVYLWCDGDDPAFISRKLKRFEEFGRVFTEENYGDRRFKQHNELLYSLRSAFANVPWVNHIYIVTDRQVPNWLDVGGKVSIVDHSEIIPKGLLPTYASTTIEMYLDNIPGLAEQFIYSNDDMFFAKPLNPSDFFDEDGRPIVWLCPAKRLSVEEAKKICEDSTRDDWGRTLVNAWYWFVRRSGKIVPFYTPAHSVDAYTKKIFRDIKNSYPYLLTVNSEPFRTGNRVSRLIFSYEMIFNYGCRLILRKSNNFFARLLAMFWEPKGYVAISRENPVKLKRDIDILKPNTFCLNNLSSENDESAKKLLEELWPEPAPWEK